MTWTRLGARYKKTRSRDNRWGPGKVHIEVYERINKVWYPLCNPASVNKSFGTGWEDAEDDSEVDCRVCLKQEPTWRKK